MMQAKAKDKQDDLQFEAGGGHGVDALGHGALDQAASRLDRANLLYHASGPSGACRLAPNLRLRHLRERGSSRNSRRQGKHLISPYLVVKCNQ